MKQIVIDTLKTTQGINEIDKREFQMFGFDFMIDIE